MVTGVCVSRNEQDVDSVDKQKDFIKQKTNEGAKQQGKQYKQKTSHQKDIIFPVAQ